MKKTISQILCGEEVMEKDLNVIDKDYLLIMIRDSLDFKSEKELLNVIRFLNNDIAKDFAISFFKEIIQSGKISKKMLMNPLIFNEISTFSSKYREKIFEDVI